MIRRFCLTFVLVSLSVFARVYGASPNAPTDPRSTVTAFLQACHDGNYDQAAQFLDLSGIAAKQRAQEGPKLARDLESLLNSTSSFDVLQLSQNAEGNLEDDTDPSIEHVTTVTNKNQQFIVELHRSQPANGPATWMFSAQTVSKLPDLAPSPDTESQIEAHLPPFLVKTLVLETPLWKWLALLITALILFALFRLFVRLFDRFVRSLATRFQRTGPIAWLGAIVNPLLVLFVVALFRICEELIAPAALVRLYLGRALLLLVVGSFAWGLINLLDYLIVRLDHALNQRQRVVSRSVIYLGRRTMKTVIAMCAAILVLDNWGFNMTTIIAGLGVGGIAVALAAQQTIANIFGGVSVIGDSPVMVGDFGNFGGVIGTVEDIGLRSARVRTLNRTVTSIPNSVFAGMNLENYAVRDKILFNPIFTIKRATPKEQIRQFMDALHGMLKSKKQVEIGAAPVRISAYAAASFSIEVFAYILTSDIDEFYRHQADLYLAIDEVVTSSGIELV